MQKYHKVDGSFTSGLPLLSSRSSVIKGTLPCFRPNTVAVDDNKSKISRLESHRFGAI